MSSIVVRIDSTDHRRRYALEQLLTVILGMEVDFCSTSIPEGRYSLEYEGKTLTICCAEELTPKYVPNPWGPTRDIVMLYGSSAEVETQSRSLIDGLQCDIAMTVFYMLSRVEEIGAAPEKLDQHGRYKYTSSIASRMGFIDRPIVNEYAEMVVNLFKKMDTALPCKRQGAKILYTHDVDILTYEPILKGMAGDILKRHDLLSALKRVRNLWYDEHDTFDALMDMSEKQGRKGLFNIMSTHYDYNQPIGKNYLHKRAFANMLEKITKRGHDLGYHPGYYTSDDEKEWKREREKVEQRIGKRLTEGRQHYLRVFVPRTLEIWEDNEMETDSSLGYADRTGFRCGTGCKYHPYDFRTQRAMKLWEQPLILMDETMKKYEVLTEAEKKERIKLYDSLSVKYDMPVTFLYHN